MPVELVPIEGIGEIAAGDDLGSILGERLRPLQPAESDVLVVTSKVVSKAEGRVVSGIDRREAIGSEAHRIVARRGDLVIAQTRQGFVCANAGVDESNVGRGALALLPEDPDASADRIASGVRAVLAEAPAIVISDTFGRPWRAGVLNVAIGCAGLPALIDLRGKPDHTGRSLEATVLAFADEIAAAAGLVMPKTWFALVPRTSSDGARSRRCPPAGPSELSVPERSTRDPSKKPWLRPARPRRPITRGRGCSSRSPKNEPSASYSMGSPRRGAET